MGYAAAETQKGWEIVAPGGGRLRVGSTLDEASPVLRLRDGTACGKVLAALADGHLEPSGTTADGDPVLDIDEYRAWYENL